MGIKKLKKWTDVYPQGTKIGDEEQRFFMALARNAKYSWRSVSAIAKESGLSLKRVDEIIQKYQKKGMVLQSPTNEDNWGYWERNLDALAEDKASITKTDQDERIDNTINPSKACYAKPDSKEEVKNTLHSVAVQDAVAVKTAPVYANNSNASFSSNSSSSIFSLTAEQTEMLSKNGFLVTAEQQNRSELVLPMDLQMSFVWEYKI